MSLLASLSRIVDDCRLEYERSLIWDEPVPFRLKDRMGAGEDNRLILGDNLDWLRYWVRN